MKKEKFDRNFPIHTRVTVKNWENHENDRFEVVYVGDEGFILRSEKTDIKYHIDYLEETFSDYSRAVLLPEDIKPGRVYTSEYGLIRVLGVSKEDKEVAIQYDDDSLAIWSILKSTQRLNQ